MWRNEGKDVSNVAGKLEETSVAEEALDRRKYSKRKMDSNWTKYEEPMDTGSNVKGLDFSEFVDKKTETRDSHFRFSSERVWNVVLDEKVSDYFKLNVKDLCTEIMCVPLHERLRLKSSVLTKEQIDMFENDAKLRLRMEEQNPITKEIEDKMVSLLKEDIPADESSWLCSLQEEEQSDKPTTWHDNSENFFTLGGLDHELDMILSMPLPSTEPEGLYYSTYNYVGYFKNNFSHNTNNLIYFHIFSIQLH